MKIYIGACLSKKNSKYLKTFLDSLKNLEYSKYHNLTFVFIIEKKNFFIKNIISTELSNKKKYKIIFTDKNGIPQCRNIFIDFLNKNPSEYSGFIDDDCIISKKWLIKMIKFIKKNNCDIVGGPQYHSVSNKKFLNLFNLIEPKRYHNQKIKWIATNNSFFKSKIITKSGIKFDEKFKNIGGSDQLFFKLLINKKNIKCRWNLNSYVTENIQKERERLSWFLRRNLRYGYSGSLIDKKIYGNIIGSFINILKVFFLLFLSITYFFFIFLKNNFIKSLFFFFRFLGRFLGLFNYIPKKYI